MNASRRAFTLLELLVVVALVAVLLALLLVAVHKARDASARLACKNQLRQLGLALHQSHDAHGHFPSGVRHFVFLPGVGTDDLEPYPLLAWHARLLPFVEQEALWRQTTEAYAQDRHYIKNPPHPTMTHVRLFVCPADGPRPPFTGSSVRPGLTSYLGVEGVSSSAPKGMLFLDSATRFADVADGTSQTLFVGERPPSADGGVGRWYGGWGTWGNTNSFLGVRENFLSDPKCPPGPYSLRRGRLDDPCSVYHFWSLHSGGANFLFVDGSVRFLPYSAADQMPALATRAGGEVVALP